MKHALRNFRTSAAVVLCTMLLASSALAQSHPAAAPDSPYGGTTVEEVIARVNDQIITRSDYDRALKDMDDQARTNGETTLQQISAHHADLLRSLIDQQLWLSKGKELSITGDTELIKKLDEIRKQYNLATMEDLEKAAKDQGISYEDFKANIRNNIITQLVMRDQVGHRVQITPGEVQQYYEEHKKDYIRPESVRLSEILISAGTDAPAAAQIDSDTTEADPAKLAAAKAKADEIEAKLKAGGDFSELARTFSNGTTAAQGGDLGEFKRGSLAKLLEDQTFVLKAGQFTAPIHTRQGYVILKVVEHTAGGAAPFKEVEDQVGDALYMSRIEPAMRAYLTQMREEAYIDIKPGYVDTGASPLQTKPIYSAYTPPAPKKKKQVARTRYRESGSTFRQKKTPPPSEDTTAAAKPAEKKTKTAGKKTVAVAKTEKPGKREKVRYGQAPRETLPTTAQDTKTVDAGALTAEAANNQQPANPLEQKPVAPTHKTRYSSHSFEIYKQKKEAAKKAADAVTPPAEDAAEVADRQTQAAPLGLGGDTASKKKKKKTTATTGEKTRMSDSKKSSATAPQTPIPPAPIQ